MDRNRHFKDFLDQRLSNVFPGKTIFSLDSEVTVDAALKFLAQRRIQSAPVYEGKAERFLALVDSFALMEYVLAAYPQDEQEDFFRNIAFAGFALEKPLSSVLPGTRGPDGDPLNGTETLQDVTERLSGRRVYRLPVVEGGRVVQIVSQFDVVALAARHLTDKDGSIRDHLRLNTPETVGDTETAAHAVRLLQVRWILFVVSFFRSDSSFVQAQGFSALAVTDKDGRLTQTFEAQDLMGRVDSDSFAEMISSLRLFLKGKAPPLVVKEHQSLRELCEALVAHHAHQAYVVDLRHRPQAIVTLTDVLRALLKLK